MANEFGGLTAFDENGVVAETETEVEGQETGAPEAQPETAPAARAAPVVKNVREWPSDGTRQRGPDGKFQGEDPAPSAADKPKETINGKAPAPAAPPAPERRKFRVPKDDGSGHDELELTDDEVAQRVADARKLVVENARERQEHEKQAREIKGVKGFIDALKAGKSREQALLGLMRSTGMSEEDCEDTLAVALHGYVKDAELTPEQRRIKELEDFKAQHEEREREEAATAEVRQFEETTRSRAEEYSALWGQALAKTGLPATPELLADIGREHMLNLKRGLKLTADELASYVNQKHDRDLGLRLKDFTPEEFAKRFPDAAKAWTARTDEMEPAAFMKAHPAMAKKLLVHYRTLARAAGRSPAVGSTRPAVRTAPTPKPADDAPRFYDRFNPTGQ